MAHADRAGDPAQGLLRIRDVDGRLCGLGFLADGRGTVVTAYEVVAGLPRVVLHTPGGQTRVLGRDSIDLLPDRGVALLRTEAVGGLPGPVLAIAAAPDASPVLVPHHRWEDGEPVLLRGTVGGRTADGAVLLALDPPGTARAAPPVPAAGTPVLDAETGGVVAVVAPGGDLPAAPPGPRDAAEPPGVPVVPLSGALPEELLLRNAAAVPGHGRLLNLGGVLQLASVQLGTASAGPGRIAELAADRVDRPDGLSGEEPRHPLTVLLGDAGSGRTTELAALAVRRAGGPHPLPTVWLRGADLAPADRSLADTVTRVLAAAAGRLEVPPPAAERVAEVCAAAGRPLLVVLDGAEEAPLEPSPAWLGASAEWLHRSGVRLLTACRPDGWEHLADGWRTEAELLWLGPLPPDAAARAARRAGVPAGYLDGPAAAHPLALRLAGELHSAGVRGPVPGVTDLFAARLDLYGLRIARRLAGANGPRRPGAHRRGGPPPAPEDAGQVRRTAAVVAARVHEAARLMLGVGHGGLDREAFDGLFPAAGGWAGAVLEEGLFVPAADGYRLAHEEWADWLQSLHLDLDGALRLLLAEGPPDGPRTGPDGDGPSADRTPPEEPADGHGVPRHRVGVVLAGLRRIGDLHGAPALDGWLHRIRLALEAAEPGGEADWWAGRLLAAALPRSPDPGAHRDLLARLAERADRDARFGPGFWTALPLALPDRLALLRPLVRADGLEGAFGAAAADLLAAEPGTAVPLLCTWFEDPQEAVAAFAEELLFTHRHLALDELTEALVGAGHPRADRLLGRLAAEEPSALCRAVDRWSHDPRPERHVAAAVHALRTAPYARGSGAQLLRHGALALLARPEERELHGAALALLVRDPETRARHLPAALDAHRAGDPFVTAEVLAAALPDHPGPVLAALADRLAQPDAPVADGLRMLARTADPALVGRCSRLAARLLRARPDRAEAVAGYLDALLARDLDARPLLAELRTAPPPVRRALALVLAAPGHGARAPLLDALLAAERDSGVLAAVLDRVAEDCARHDPARVRDLVRRITARWPGADAALARRTRREPALAALLADRPPDGPDGPDGPDAPTTPRTGALRGCSVGESPQLSGFDRHGTDSVP
ncbi:NACHT domain-containing protein [Kitasatospora camelliae]|uniref:NACHT domain-containing protein n=1 Tax=Kitasatospora camelliae TaxID=3156397 RepID=A0AAU8JX22_9ACTN